MTSRYSRMMDMSRLRRVIRCRVVTTGLRSRVRMVAVAKGQMTVEKIPQEFSRHQDDPDYQ